MPITEQNYQCKNSNRQGIHKALEKEYEYVSRISSEQTIKITNGIFQSTIGDKFIYRFQLPKEPEKTIEPDRPYLLRIDRKEIKGAIYSLTEYYVEVELHEDWGKHVPIIEIIVDLTILIDLVDRTIVKIDKEPSKFEISTSDNLLQPKPIEIKQEKQLNHKQRKDNISLNEEQEKSIINSLNRKLNIIWGPPGTGKTKTLQGVIAEFLSKDKKILFASNTNNAIDGLLEPFVNKPPYQVIDDLKKEDKIVRVGNQSNELVKNTFSPYAISEKRAKDINNEINNITDEINSKKEKIAALNSILNKYKKYLHLKAEIENLQTEKEKIPQKAGLESQIQFIETTSKKLITLVDFYESKFYDKPIHLEKNSQQLLKIIQNKRGLNIRISQSQKKLEKLYGERTVIEDNIEKIKNNFLKRVFNNKIKSLEYQLSKINEEISYLERNYQSEQNQLNDLIAKEAELLSKISEDVNIVSKYSKTFDYNNLYELLDILGLLSSMNNKSLNELPKLKEEYDFLDDDTLYFINFLWNISSITKNEIIKKQNSEKERIQRKILANDEKLNRYESKIEENNRELEKLKDIANFPKDYWEDIKSEIAGYQEQIKEHQNTIDELKNKIQGLNSQIIQNAQLVCSTLVKASYDEKIINSRFDILIIDEVSMVSIPQLYCAASITREKIILCGDHLQLQPISQSKSEYAKKWLASSYFGFIENTDEMKKRNYELVELKPFMSTLSEQRRMPNAISEIIKIWYDKAGNKLKDIKKNNKEEIENFYSRLKSHFLSSKDNVYIFETKDLRTYHNRTEDRSPYNFINAVIVAELLRELIEEYNISPEEILCVSPYRAQYQLTWAIFNKLYNGKTTVSKSLISSVHKTQGKEASILIYDLTEGSQGKLTYFLRTDEIFIHNVAISRSKEKILFVGDTEKFEKIKEKEPNAAFNHVYKKIKSSAKIINANTYKNRIFESYDVKDLIHQNTFDYTDELKDKFTIVPSSLYYELLNNDILRAKENITIVSPFITPKRWSKIRPLITSLLESNPDLKVEILTKPPEKMFGKEKDNINMAAVKVLNDFSELGFKIKLSEKIHSKLIVIDRGTENATAFMGSLNPLSFNDTDEINVRIVDTEISEQLIKMSMVGQINSYKQKKISESDYYDDIKEAVNYELNQFKWILAGYYHKHIGLFRKVTFNYILENLPYTDNEFKAVPKIDSPSNVLLQHLDQIRNILSPLYDYKTTKTNPSQQSLFDD